MDQTLAAQAESLFGLQLDQAQLEACAHYVALLDDWNTRINLTAISDAAAVRVRHFLDSFSIASAFRFTPGLTMIDVGTGAGFPGLPLKIAYPASKLTLLEATGKKVAFLDAVVKDLALDQVQTMHARAEDAGHMPNQREAYDLVLARAVARLPALVEYLLPLARIGGTCIAMKGETAAQEIEDAARAIDLLGGRFKQLVPVSLPGVDETHYLIIIDKVAHTPPSYPRQPGIPSRQPLV